MTVRQSLKQDKNYFDLKFIPTYITIIDGRVEGVGGPQPTRQKFWEGTVPSGFSMKNIAKTAHKTVLAE